MRGSRRLPGDSVIGRTRTPASPTVSTALVASGLAVIGFAGGTVGTAAGIVLAGAGAAGLGPSVLVLLGMVVPAERRGTGAGLLQLCGDVGGMLGPLVGTALFATSTELPYLLTAALVAAFVPVAWWLRRIERTAV